jgi:ubiquinone/menaquinone biosynthesis C-methylase UbiE
MNELKKLPKSSMDIVFDSFFLFDYSRERRNFIRKKMEKDYFREAMRVLKPNGRIITIQARFNEQFIREHAKKLGLRMHTIRLTQKQLDESSATWVKKRATKKGRMEVLEGNFSPDDEYSMRMFKESLRQVGIKQLEEAHYPVAIILRK